uniref:Uncharacterized protein n=1 Tax=Knipowitschia caucasica TaxID=637954 RepID=A0AAV2KEQ9_KNICA
MNPDQLRKSGTKKRKRRKKTKKRNREKRSQDAEKLRYAATTDPLPPSPPSLFPRCLALILGTAVFVAPSVCWRVVVIRR